MKIPQALCTVPEDFVTDFYMISSYQQEEELYYMEQKKNLVTLGSTGITVEKNSFQDRSHHNRRLLEGVAYFPGKIKNRLYRHLSVP